MVLLFQLHVPAVFTEQPGHDVVDQESPQIDAQQEQGIGGLQGHIQAGLPAAIEMVEPQQIEGGRNQPQIPPYGSVRLFLHRVRIHIPDVEEQRDQDDGLHRCHEDGKRPPICLHRKPGEDLPLQAFGADHHQIGDVGQHEQGEQGLPRVRPDGPKVEQEIESRAGCADKSFLVSGRKGRQQPQSHLQERHQSRQHAGSPPGIAQMLPEGIEGQEQIGQEIQQGIHADFQDSVERRHHSPISFRIRWKRKAA